MLVIQNTDAAIPKDEREWHAFVIGGPPLTIEEAFEYCRTLACAPGSQTSWRVVDTETGKRLLAITCSKVQQ